MTRARIFHALTAVVALIALVLFFAVLAVLREYDRRMRPTLAASRALTGS